MQAGHLSSLEQPRVVTEAMLQYLDKNTEKQTEDQHAPSNPG
ncbi:hypothetical protein [Microbulbifer halophilus]|nr:hypothetical protein [Microbulbifer halophilus]MCW8127922.1 hypothetical protein [Microbulbifer halophilus]